MSSITIKSLNTNGKTRGQRQAEIQITMSKEELIPALEKHSFFCHMFAHQIMDKLEQSGIYLYGCDSWRQLKPSIHEVIRPLVRRFPLRFRSDWETINLEVIGYYMIRKYKKGDVRSNMMKALDPGETMTWNLNFVW